MVKLILFTALIGSSWAEAKTYKFIGEARNRQGELVYTENHEATENSSGRIIRLVTEYKRPDGSVLVKMDSDFSKNILIPTIQFEDVRFERRETLSHDNKKAHVKILQKQKTRENSFSITKNMVAGTGFHNFILENFESLKNEKAIPISFIVLAKADHFSFDLVKKKIEGDKLVLTLRIKSWILKNFIDPITVEYDLKSKQLLTFDGLTNIESDAGKSQELKITYKY